MTDSTSLIGNADLDQIGIVVHDLYAVTQELTRLFGIGPFRIFEWPLEGVDPQATYHGQPASFRLLLAFVTVGKIQIEIVQPLEGQNIYSDFLRDHGPGLHHFRLTVPGFEQGVAALTSGGTKAATDAPRRSAIPDIDIDVFIVRVFMASSSMDG